MATTTTTTPPPSSAAVAQHHKSIQQHLALQILLADRLAKSAKDLPSSNKSSSSDCSHLATLASHLSLLLRSTARLSANTTTTFYDRPLRSIFSHLSSTLQRAQTLVRRYKHCNNNIFRQVFSITTSADVRKVSNLLESSIADLKWLLSIFNDNNNNNYNNNSTGGGGGGGPHLSLPPIASNDPVLAWVWSHIASVQHSSELKDRVDSANSLASLAADSERNIKIIIQENGIPPLLKMLKEAGSPESQIAAGSALYSLAADPEKVAGFVPFMAVPAIAKALAGSNVVGVRVNLVDLVSRMAEMDSRVREEFGRENVVRPIVTFLANGMEIGGFRSSSSSSLLSFGGDGKEPERGLRSSLSFPLLSLRDNREPDVCGLSEEKRKLLISCGKALWVLAKGSLLNSRKITETKALICLSKLIEHETGELQANCLMTVMELAAVAESNADLRRQAFKPNTPAARAVLDQLLRVVNQERDPSLVVPAITAIGSLARTFPAKETRVIGPLVSKLEDRFIDVGVEAVVALTKFVSPGNFNCVEHSKAILDSDGVPRLMGFLKNNDDFKIRVHGLKLLCYLALHVGNSDALEEARALIVMEAAARSVVTQCPELKELFAKAIHHLNLYQAGTHTHKQAYVP